MNKLTETGKLNQNFAELRIRYRCRLEWNRETNFINGSLGLSFNF